MVHRESYDFPGFGPNLVKGEMNSFEFLHKLNSGAQGIRNGEGHGLQSLMVLTQNPGLTTYYLKIFIQAT